MRKALAILATVATVGATAVTAPAQARGWGWGPGIGIGLAVMGWFISLDQPGAFHPMLGVGSLVGLIGVALLIGSAFAGRPNGTDKG